MRPTIVKPLLAMVVFAIVSCAQLSGSSKSRFLSQFDINNVSGSEKYAGYLETTYLNSEDGNLTWHTWGRARANLYDINGNARNLTGSLDLNGNSLGYDHEYSGMNLGWKNPQIWSTEDDGNIGKFSDTITPPNLFTISFPRQITTHDSISISNGFEIDYSTTGSDSVWIYLATDPLLGHAINTKISSSDSTYTFLSAKTKSTGSYRVSKSTLSGFPTQGAMDVHVIAQKWKITQHLGRSYYISSIVDAHTSVLIKP